MKVKFIIVGLTLLLINAAHSALEVTIIKQDENAIPIAIAPFTLIGQQDHNSDIAKIVSLDLERSGRFQVVNPSKITQPIQNADWKKRNVEAVVVGSIEQKNKNIYQLSVRLFDVYGNKTLFNKSIAVHQNGFRRVAHQLSDYIYEELLGESGAFNTLLTYVHIIKDAKGNKQYHLNISDADAQNVKSRIRLNSPILSPVWSPDRAYKDKKIAYVSFQNNRSEVFIWHPYIRRKIEKLPYFDGIASSPSWHPNGKSLLLTLSKAGNKDIYSYNLADKQLTRITKNPSIDTEASYSPDGKRIVFTSNRSGQVQVYIKDLTTGKVRRATFEGRYNAKAVFSPDGERLALVHRINSDYRIAILDIKSKDLNIITHNTLDESPYFSPNGEMIIFATNLKDKGLLSVISVAGQRSYTLSSQAGEVREPNWSTYLQ